MEIRIASENDFEAIRALYEQARAYFRENGINQWQKGYPEDAVIHADIAAGVSYVCEEQQHVIATFVATDHKAPSYENIVDGWWHRDEGYIAIHRVVVDATHKGHGIGSKIISYVESNLLTDSKGYLKADTHIDNQPMQRLLLKNGFQKAGIIRIARGSDRGEKRIAFDKILK